MRTRYGTQGYYALRWAVLSRDDFTCQYCGQKAPNVKLEVDHVIPVEDGGEDSISNLLTSCYACNRGRSGLSIRIRRGGKIADFKIKPLQLPFRQKQIMDVLANNDGMRLPEIAEILTAPTNIIRTLLHRYTKRGWVVRDDNRKYRVSSDNNEVTLSDTVATHLRNTPY